MKYSLPALVAVFLCLGFEISETRAEEFDVTNVQTASYSQSGQTSRQRDNRRGRITGPTQGLDRSLVRRLNAMSVHFGGTVNLTPNGGCRPHGSRSAPRSQHRIAAGCRAADVWIEGVRGADILRYWRDNGGGGRGRYKGRPFVHVDTGTSRNWAWGYNNPRRYEI